MEPLDNRAVVLSRHEAFKQFFPWYSLSYMRADCIELFRHYSAAGYLRFPTNLSSATSHLPTYVSVSIIEITSRMGVWMDSYPFPVLVMCSLDLSRSWFGRRSSLHRIEPPTVITVQL